MEVSKHIAKAEEAIQKKNFDFAAGYLQQVLSVQPDHGEARQLMCRALRMRHERKPTPGWLAKIVGAPHLLSAVMCRLTRSSAGQARALEKYLKLEPANPSVYQSLGLALASSGHTHSAAAVFQAMAEIDPKSSTPWRLAAGCLAQVQETDRALECLEKALALNPRDAEADRMRKNLAAEQTIKKGAYDKAKSSRDLMRDKKQVEKVEQETRIHRSDEELVDEQGELEKHQAAGTLDARSRRRLAELLAKRQEFSAAVKVLEAAKDKDDNPQDLQDRIGDYRMTALKGEIEKLKARMGQKPSEGVKADLAQLEDDLRALELSEFERRVEARPTDLGLCFALGRTLREAGRLDQAIGALQKSVKDPRTRIDSLILLGESFFDKGILDLAGKQFAAALESLAPASERGKSVLYSQAKTAEKAGKKDEAIAHFSRIYEIDIQYRDVAQRLEALRAR